MRAGRRIVAIGLLLVSWCVLFWLTGSRTPWRDVFTETDGHLTMSLGDVAVQQYQRMGFTAGLVEYGRANNTWLVGTEKGEILCVNMQGKRLWQRSLGIGKITALTTNKNGNIVYVGEQSPSGNIYALDTKSGDVLWRFSAESGVGSVVSERSYPSVTRILSGDNGNIYLGVYRLQTNAQGERDYFSRFYELNNRGELIWQFPVDKPLDAWSNWFDVSKTNNTLAFATCNYDWREQLIYKENLYFVDMRTSQVQGIHIQAVQPFNRTVMRTSPNYSVDGQRLAALASDGRGFVFDQTGKILWQVEVAQPQQVRGEWVAAIGRTAQFTDYGVLFSTLNTFGNRSWKNMLPVEHPGSNSLVLFSDEGKFLAKFKTKGNIEDSVVKKHLLAAAVGRNIRNRTYKGHGVLLVNLANKQVEEFYATAGPVQGVALSDDLKHLAAVEVPAQIDNGEIIGSYKLHIWQLGN